MAGGEERFELAAPVEEALLHADWRSQLAVDGVAVGGETGVAGVVEIVLREGGILVAHE